MKRVIVIGSGGAGKSTFSRRLHELTDLPLFHLDQIFWKPNWTETSKDEWKKTVEELLEKDEWILDGNFGGTMEMRIEACDTVFWLDFPRMVCVSQALKRVIKYYNKNRPDMGEGCNEKFDLEFFWWVWTFKRSKSGKNLETLIEKFKDSKNIKHFKSNREIESFFENLKQNKVKST